MPHYVTTFWLTYSRFRITKKKIKEKNHFESRIETRRPLKTSHDWYRKCAAIYTVNAMLKIFLSFNSVKLIWKLCRELFDDSELATKKFMDFIRFNRIRKDSSRENPPKVGFHAIDSVVNYANPKWEKKVFAGHTAHVSHDHFRRKYESKRFYGSMLKFCFHFADEIHNFAQISRGKFKNKNQKKY